MLCSLSEHCCSSPLCPSTLPPCPQRHVPGDMSLTLNLSPGTSPVMLHSLSQQPWSSPPSLLCSPSHLSLSHQRQGHRDRDRETHTLHQFQILLTSKLGMAYQVLIVITLQRQVESRGGSVPVPSLMPGECPSLSLEDIDMSTVCVTQGLKHEVVPPCPWLGHVPQVEQHRLSYKEALVLALVVLHSFDSSIPCVPGGQVPVESSGKGCKHAVAITRDPRCLVDSRDKGDTRDMGDQMDRDMSEGVEWSD